MSKRKIIMPSEAENAVITTGIESDPDDFEADAKWLSNAKRHRGEQKAPKKVPVSLRLDADIVQAYRESGSGWQRRVNQVLRESIVGGADPKVLRGDSGKFISASTPKKTRKSR